MTKIMKVEFLEAPICSSLPRATQEKMESLKRDGFYPGPLSSIDTELELDQRSFIQFPETPPRKLWAQLQNEDHGP